MYIYVEKFLYLCPFQRDCFSNENFIGDKRIRKFLNLFRLACIFNFILQLHVCSFFYDLKNESENLIN